MQSEYSQIGLVHYSLQFFDILEIQKLIKTLKLVISVFCINGIQDQTDQILSIETQMCLLKKISLHCYFWSFPLHFVVQTSNTHTQSMYLKYILQYVGYENKLLSTEYESRNETFACIYKKGLPFTVQSTLWIFN